MFCSFICYNLATQLRGQTKICTYEIKSMEDQDNIESPNQKLEFPFSIEPLTSDTQSELLKHFTGLSRGLVLVGPKKYCLPALYADYASDFYNFQARKDDIWIAGFPRSGTTMLQEMIWLIANDFDYHTAQQKVTYERTLSFEAAFFANQKLRDGLLCEQNGNKANEEYIMAKSLPTYKLLEDMKTRRFIKSHLPFSLLPPSIMEQQSKVIYVARNPKDVAISFYHLTRLVRSIGFTGDFSTFWNYFENGLVPWAPYFENVNEGWELRTAPNVLFLFYENIMKDLPATIRKVADFLEKTITNEQIIQLTDYLNIENFRKNPSVNQQDLYNVKLLNKDEEPFIRNGKITSKKWQKEYTQEIIERAEAWLERNQQTTSLRFPNDL